MSQSTTDRSPSGERHAPGRGGPLAHVLLNIALAALFTALFVRAQALPSSMWEPLGSGSFPRLVLAALATEGTTQVSRIYHLDRGYADLEDKLGRCGARMKRV